MLSSGPGRPADSEAFEALSHFFAGMPRVEIAKGSILAQDGAVEAFVSPANTIGNMDGYAHISKYPVVVPFNQFLGIVRKPSIYGTVLLHQTLSTKHLHTQTSAYLAAVASTRSTRRTSAGRPARVAPTTTPHHHAGHSTPYRYSAASDGGVTRNTSTRGTHGGALGS